MKKLKKVPNFRSEAAERKFWETHDTTEYLDWKQAKKVILPSLKSTLKNISLRLPISMLAELKLLANKKDVPYQSLMKIFLAERVQDELNSYRAH